MYVFNQCGLMFLLFAILENLVFGYVFLKWLIPLVVQSFMSKPYQSFKRRKLSTLNFYVPISSGYVPIQKSCMKMYIFLTKVKPKQNGNYVDCKFLWRFTIYIFESFLISTYLLFLIVNYCCLVMNSSSIYVFDKLCNNIIFQVTIENVSSHPY